MLVRRLTKSHFLKIEINLDLIMSMFANGRELWWEGRLWLSCSEEIKGKGHLTLVGRVTAEVQIKPHPRAAVPG